MQIDAAAKRSAIEKDKERLLDMEAQKLKLRQEINDIEKKLKKSGDTGASSSKRPAIKPKAKGDEMVYQILAERRRKERESASAVARREDEFSDEEFVKIVQSLWGGLVLILGSAGQS